MVNSIFEHSNTNIMVEFRILGDDFNLDYITEVLSIIPTECWSKGDFVKNRNAIRKYTCWEVSSGYKESLDINTQLDEIINIFYNKIDNLITLKKKFDIEYFIEIVINVENDIKPTMCLNRRSIEFAYLIGAEVDFDLYIF